ncbi:hypothetical protein ACN0IJ_08015 [Shewanella indica]
MMLRFGYEVEQQKVELQASNWNGFERLFVDGKMVSSKFNLGLKSEHSFELRNGARCRMQLLVDPTTELTICRIYKCNRLLASLKQGKQQPNNSHMQHWLLLGGLVCVLLVYL